MPLDFAKDQWHHFYQFIVLFVVLVMGHKRKFIIRFIYGNLSILKLLTHTWTFVGKLTVNEYGHLSSIMSMVESEQYLKRKKNIQIRGRRSSCITSILREIFRFTS